MPTAREQFFNSASAATTTIRPTNVAVSSLGFGIEVVGNDGNDKRVYNATTVPITNTNTSNWRNVQANTAINYANVQKLEQSVNDTTASAYNNEVEPFLNLPAREPVDLEFKELSLTVNLGFFKGNKEILHNVCGKFPGGHLIAIMGPSGAGKSTLLDALSGFKTTGVNGAILLNGRRRDLNAFRRMSCYITQDDRLSPLLTVNENMHIAADLKLGSTVSFEEKENRIEDILLLLGLYNHDQTAAQRLSGGQKKRLSIAMELINNPTVMFLDEPTTGLDSSSCTKVLELLKKLAQQGRTIICTIHQPTAKLFQIFDQVYVLSAGNCLYQGSTHKLVTFLQAVNMPCPMYHNPADYIIELACGEYGYDKIDMLKSAAENGSCLAWFENPSRIMRAELLIRKYPIVKRSKQNSLEDTSYSNQCTTLMRRGYIKAKRNTMLTHLRILINIFVGVLLGVIYVNSGREGSRVLDNFNLLFAILIHLIMSSMMLTVVTFPIEMSILIKEHFNRWYSLKAYYTSLTIVDLPVSIISCLLFSFIIYGWSYQPMEWSRFCKFFAISLLTVFVGESLGLLVGAWFDVVNGTFVAPVLTVPMMMFAGFGVTLRDLPSYLKWGSYISYLRYALEGYISAIYGDNRGILACNEAVYCHYRYPKKFLEEISMSGDQFWTDVIALSITIIILRIFSYMALNAKIKSIK